MHYGNRSSKTSEDFEDKFKKTIRFQRYPGKQSSIMAKRNIRCAQLFPAKNEIRLMICDTDVGIYKALTSSEKLIFHEKTEEDALRLCIEKGVTNGEGMGFGLYASSEFIKHNKGQMIIYSPAIIFAILKMGMYLF